MLIKIQIKHYTYVTSTTTLHFFVYILEIDALLPSMHVNTSPLKNVALNTGDSSATTPVCSPSQINVIERTQTKAIISKTVVDMVKYP